jgi:hypothetical protein
VDREDWEDTDVCVLCGEAVSTGSERGYVFGTGNLLCWSCATKRGGQYDTLRDSWEVAPDVGGLPDEAYGCAPHEVRRKRG